MDVGKISHRDELSKRKLLFGVVAYASGKLGKEFVRSQGHVHAISRRHCQCSTPELLEIWQGRAVVYMQAADDPGRCFAVEAEPGDKVVIPLRAHCGQCRSGGSDGIFGAWCVRDYGFDYPQSERTAASPGFRCRMKAEASNGNAILLTR